MSRTNAKPVYIKNDLYLKLKIVAAFKNTTVTQLVHNMLYEHLPCIQSLASELGNEDETGM